MLTPIILRRRELLWLTLVLILFPHATLRALQAKAPSGEKIAFKHLTIDDGLSQNAVFAMLQDHQGFIWFGTKDGLNRYDGYSFTVYQHNPFDLTSLSANYITALFEDSRGVIWIGTTDGGLNRLQRGTKSFQRLHNLSSRSQNFSAQEITAMAEDSTGAIWVGTRGDGLFRFSPQPIQTSGEVACTQFVHAPGKANNLSSNSINVLRVDGKGTLWIGTINGLDKLRNVQNGEGFEHFVIFTKNPQAPNSARDSSVAAIYEDSKGRFWLGTSSGICLFDRNSGRYQNFSHHYEIYRYGWGIVNGIVEDQAGQLWLATPGELMRFNPADHSYDYFRNDPLAPHSLSYNNVSSLWRDRSGVLWFGTLGGGINVFDPKTRRFSLLVRPPEPSSRIAGFSVRSILEDDAGDLWISTEVLYRWNRKTGVLKSFETSSNRPDDFGNTGAWSMRQSADGAIWFATHQGLYRYELQSGKIRQYKFNPADTSGLRQKEVYAVYEDRRGTIWIATENYFSQLIDAKNGRFRHFHYRPSPPNNEIVRPAIYQDGKGRFWLGTKEGLLQFDLETESFHAYRNDPRQPASLSNNEIKSICPDPQHPNSMLWLGTAGGGLNGFDLETKTFRHYTERDGLPNNTVYGILPDDEGNLWLSTNKGLSRFTPWDNLVQGQPSRHTISSHGVNRLTGTFRNYDVRDGLQSNEFNTGAYYKSKNGELFFGGISGLNYFYPADILDNPHPPPIAITRCKILSQSESHQDSSAIFYKTIFENSALALSPRDNIITFEFAALDFSAPEKNQYAYKMENFDQDWIHAGAARSATYSNLPPGEYTFRVKGSNNDGIWNEAGASLKIIIAPPWWKTWWAYTLYVLFFTSLLYLVRRYELNRLQLKNRLRLEHVEAEKLRELDHMKSRFFANLSHEFRTPLTLILGPMDSLLAMAESQQAKQSLQMMRRNAGRLLQLINQLLDLSKLESGSMRLQAACQDVIPVLRGIVMTFQSMAERKDIALLFRSEVETLTLYFDHEKFEKIFFNLLANAIKFTPNGGKISVQLAVISNQSSVCSGQWSAVSKQSQHKQPNTEHWSLITDNCLLITVKDTGIGIPHEKLPHIFDRFYQVETSSTREFDGTGIGLSLAKELVELHHGIIAINSQEGWGTEAIVRLPLGRAHLQDDEIVEVSSQLSGTSEQPASGKLQEASEQEAWGKGQAIIEHEAIDPLTQNSINPSIQQQATNGKPIILIVEDNADMRRYLRDYLEQTYSVIEAHNGREGLEKATATIPDLVISDVMMPEMDGYALCRGLKTDEKTSHVPVILLTAKAAPEEKLAGLETGADDYLLKPFEAKELLARVKNLIQLRQKLREKFSSARLQEQMPNLENKLDQAFLQRVQKAVEENMENEKFGVEELAAKLKLSRTQLHRKISALTNQPASLFIRSVRLRHARKMLEQDGNLVNEVAYRVGFSSHAYFTKCFHEEFGCTPKEFVKSRREV
ncbi:MAG: response regulator [candidate division KSB1 bacterium]|nr:response regulator [candidate division KSB1 bacterium]MDZ7367893.1 response regulator [candidate division KSB1 bacterium]MDZ7407519.1 response regulator [candidate division KSB1 bacterium]